MSTQAPVAMTGTRPQRSVSLPVTAETAYIPSTWDEITMDTLPRE